VEHPRQLQIEREIHRSGDACDGVDHGEALADRTGQFTLRIPLSGSVSRIVGRLIVNVR
jgi:hypothetical protein